MMKQINLLLCVVSTILFSTTSAFSQKITFTLYEFDPCIKTVELSPFFILIDKTGELYIADSTGTCILPDTGKYTIRIFGETDEDRILEEFKSYSDTMRLSMIKEFFPSPADGNSDAWGYYYCEKRCNGKQIDYFTNGNKRLEGKFKNGLPIGKLYFYYSNGKLKEIKKYNKEGILKKTIRYNEKGVLVTTNK